MRPGDAPKATRRPIIAASRMANLRFGKGIRVKAAEAHESENLDENRIVVVFCICRDLDSCNIASKGIECKLWGEPGRSAFDVA